MSKRVRFKDAVSQELLSKELFNNVLSEEDEIDTILALDRQGTNFDCVDAQGYTPLMHAAVNNKLMQICVLRDVGADFDKKNSQGQTA